MRRLLLPLLALSCAAGGAAQPPIAMQHVRDNFYSAIGRTPGWILMIGDDSIAMRTLMPGADGHATAWRDYRFPRTLPRTVENVRIWETRVAAQTIRIEARHMHCRWSAGHDFDDSVRVTLNGQVFEGCGGLAFRDEGRR